MACDVANLWKACRGQFGKDARVDFRVLSEVIPAILDGPVAQKLVAYIITNPKQAHHVFVQALQDFGYEVRERFLRYEKGHGVLHTDWGVGMAIDAIDKADEYDTFVLVSGDGDFSPLLSYLKEELHKETVVLAFQNSLSSVLHRASDLIYHFSSDIIYRKHAVAKAGS